MLRTLAAALGAIYFCIGSLGRVRVSAQYLQHSLFPGLQDDQESTFLLEDASLLPSENKLLKGISGLLA